MSVLKQRVPIVFQDSDGTYKITIEWLKDLNAVIAATGTTTTTIVTANTAATAANAASIAAILVRLRKLEAGYEA